MPSLVLSDPLSASPDLMDSKISKKKSKKIESMDLDAENGRAIEEPKSEKKKKKEKKKLDSEDESEKKKEKNEKKKKRKASDEDEEDERENVKELANGSSLKKAKVMEEKEEEEEEVENPNALSKFRLSEPLKERLKSKGIESLFPIQAMTFTLVLDGSDLVGRARTGQVMNICCFCCC